MTQQKSGIRDSNLFEEPESMLVLENCHQATGFFSEPRPSTTGISSQLIHAVPLWPSTHYQQANMDQTSLTYIFLIPHQLPAFVRISTPYSFRSFPPPPCLCSLICPGIRTVSQKALLPVLRDDSHPTHHHLCPMCLSIARRCSTSVQKAFLQCGETWEERRGSN